MHVMLSSAVLLAAFALVAVAGAYPVLALYRAASGTAGGPQRLRAVLRAPARGAKETAERAAEPGPPGETGTGGGPDGSGTPQRFAAGAEIGWPAGGEARWRAGDGTGWSAGGEAGWPAGDGTGWPAGGDRAAERPGEPWQADEADGSAPGDDGPLDGILDGDWDAGDGGPDDDDPGDGGWHSRAGRRHGPGWLLLPDQPYTARGPAKSGDADEPRGSR